MMTDPDSVDHITDVWLGRPESMESYLHVVNIGAAYSNYSNTDLRTALQRFNLGTDWSSLQDKIRVYKSSKTSMTFVTYSKETSKLIANLAFRLSDTGKPLTVTQSSRFEKNYHVTFRDVPDPVVQRNLGIALHRLTRSVFCMTNPTLDDAYQNADLMVLFACTSVPPEIKDLRELTVEDSTGMENTYVFQHRWHSLNKTTPPSMKWLEDKKKAEAAAKAAAKAVAKATAAPAATTRRKAPSEAPSDQTPAPFARAHATNGRLDLQQLLNPSNTTPTVTEPISRGDIAMEESSRPVTPMATPTSAPIDAAAFQLPTHTARPRSPAPRPASTANSFDAFTLDDTEEKEDDEQDDDDMDAEAADGSSTPYFSLGSAPPASPAAKRTSVKARSKPTTKRSTKSRVCTTVVSHIAQLNHTSDLHLVQPHVWSKDSTRAVPYIAARAVERHVALHTHDATSVQDHVTNLTRDHGLQSTDPSAVFALTYPTKSDSAIYFSLASIDVMLLTWADKTTPIDYHDGSSICAATGLDSVSYHDDLLTDASLLSVVHATKAQALMRRKVGMPSEFKTAAKLLRQVPVGPATYWTRRRSSLAAGRLPTDIRQRIAASTVAMPSESPTQY